MVLEIFVTGSVETFGVRSYKVYTYLGIWVLVSKYHEFYLENYNITTLSRELLSTFPFRFRTNFLVFLSTTLTRVVYTTREIDLRKDKISIYL